MVPHSELILDKDDICVEVRKNEFEINIRVPFRPRHSIQFELYPTIDLLGDTVVVFASPLECSQARVNDLNSILDSTINKLILHSFCNEIK